jgi:chemotaxis family two-component system response regulator Rcp1
MHEGLGRPIEILLVEDNPGDVRLTIEALRDAKTSNHLTVAPDGVEALAMVRGAPPHQEAGHFDLILLDLNLPKKNGRELLADLKSDPQLKRIPVVILTTSKAEEDILKTYDLHANCYITKPVGFEEFMHVVRSIEDFWLSVVTLPGGKVDGHKFDSNTAY